LYPLWQCVHLLTSPLTWLLGILQMLVLRVLGQQMEDEEEEKETADHGGSDDIIIKLTNVHKTYLLGLEGVPALRGVNLNIFAGEFVTILGTSGGGKTTMLNIIGTIDKPSKGDIRIG